MNSSQKPSLRELGRSNMTLSGEEDLFNEATNNMAEFASTKGLTLQSVTHMTRTQLADFLRDFYGKVKVNQNDSLSLKDLRAGLHRFFLDEVNVDILGDRTFELANATFDLAVRANPRKCNRMRIEIEDLKKIYLSDAMDTNKPDSLQNKVFFDITLYICNNKGKEYFRSMKKNDFDVSRDIHGRKYVWLKDPNVPNEDEYSKIKREEENSQAFQVGQRMYERAGDPRCPLASFLKYVTHLHPMTDAFWQRPKRSVGHTDLVWFDHAPLGSSTLTKIMQRISLQAGLSDNYTNYSIRSACIPLVEAVCEEALRAEAGDFPMAGNPVPTVDIIKPQISLSSCADSPSHMSDDAASMTSMTSMTSDLTSMTSLTSDPARRAPPISHLTGHSSGTSGNGSMDADDADFCELMAAKTQVLDLIRGLFVKDIQKFVDWLKTVRVQYSAGELIVLCSPVDKSDILPVPDPPDPPTLGPMGGDPTSSLDPTTDPIHRGSPQAMDISEKRKKLRKEASVKEDMDIGGTVVTPVDFMASGSGTFCSSDELAPLQVSVPTKDTLLLTGVPADMQVMLHRKKGLASQQSESGQAESLARRVFHSHSTMDVVDALGAMTTGLPSNGNSKRSKVNSQGSFSNSPIGSHPVMYPLGEMSLVKQAALHCSPPQPGLPHSPLSPQLLTAPPPMSTLSISARDHFKDHRNKSVGCLDTGPPPMAEAGPQLKRVSSTGTPVLKRQAQVYSEPGGAGMLGESLKRQRDSLVAGQRDNGNSNNRPGQQQQIVGGGGGGQVATDLSMKPLKKTESLEQKKARADRLDSSLRYHQQILQDSPLIKRPGERSFSGFRHCYANTMAHTLKPEPLDTSYS